MDAGLVLFRKSGTRKDIPIPKSVTIIGRRHNCDLCVPLRSVSRKHCELSQEGDILKIRDLSSRNGTYVNGQRVEETELHPGDQIRIGPLIFTLQIGGKPFDIPIPQQLPPQLPKELTPADREIMETDGTFAGHEELDRSNGHSDTGIQPPDVEYDLDDFNIEDFEEQS